jgi:ferrochelatase
VPLAAFISRTRTPSAKLNYDRMGGRSPIMPETEKQAAALQVRLDGSTDAAFKVFIAMRYWRPFADEAARAVEAWGADEVVLLPLYPQFSTTTTASAMDAWREATTTPIKVACCYPTDPSFARAHADAIVTAWRKADAPASPRVLFSAHGLPEKIVAAGDPYQWQIEQTCAAVAPFLPESFETSICYQSRVGPLKWIGPSTEDALKVAAADKKGVIVSPIAFVSEHIETLVELDVEYAEKAHEWGVPFYIRAPALGTADGFVQALVSAVDRTLAGGPIVSERGEERICPKRFSGCPLPCDRIVA